MARKDTVNAHPLAQCISGKRHSELRHAHLLLSPQWGLKWPFYRHSAQSLSLSLSPGVLCVFHACCTKERSSLDFKSSSPS